MLIEMDLFVARPLPINNSYSWTMALAWERCSIVRRSSLDRETLPTLFSASSSVLALHSIGIPAIVADPELTRDEMLEIPARSAQLLPLDLGGDASFSHALISQP